ncbi:MAG: hypothetical protein MJ223_02800 [Mycoplasmoidaceae bacterium]|nr:hypothetical protein [Mycoplasmoidaceae bacterium]
MANLQQTRYINQKRYFLIVNAETLETAQRCFGIVQNELLNAGLQVNPATKEATDLCINKLIPSNGAERIDFYPKYYVVTGKDGKKTYYRTFIIHQLPKIVDAFWNQDIFNMDGLTINMSLRPLEKTESRFNQNPKTRYIQKLNTLAKDRKTRSLVEEKEQEHELMSIQELAEDVANGDEKIKIAKYLVTFSADSKLNLKIVERKVKTAITKNKMRFNFCDCKQ